MMSEHETVLSLDHLSVRLPAGADRTHALRDVSLDIASNEILCVVGESGSGKSMMANAVMRLLPNEVTIDSGRVMFWGRDLCAAPEAEMREVRGDGIAMIFQEPMTALNPVLTVGAQIAEVVELHSTSSRREAAARAVEMLRLVEIAEPERRAAAYPHQLSGGMRQRVMLAIALAARPRLLIADEPTTALDVTIQAQILDLLARLRRELAMAVLLVTHDLGVVAERADRIAVMYAGRIVETGDADAVLRQPRHPYTRGLLASIPRLGAASGTRLAAIPGMVPDLRQRPSGCRFRDRCGDAIDDCARIDPPLHRLADGRQAACIRLEPA
jgi:peptide/nickel transport system ATP-binding protein